MLWGEEQAESSNAFGEVWVRSAKKERRIFGGKEKREEAKGEIWTRQAVGVLGGGFD